MNNIKALTLKANMVQNSEYYARPLEGEDPKPKLVVGDPLKYMQGLSIFMDEVEYFVYDITFYAKTSKLVESFGIATGCYVVRFAAGSEDFCMGRVHGESLIIMEDAVATVLIQ